MDYWIQKDGYKILSVKDWQGNINQDPDNALLYMCQDYLLKALLRRDVSKEYVNIQRYAISCYKNGKYWQTPERLIKDPMGHDDYRCLASFDFARGIFIGGNNGLKHPRDLIYLSYLRDEFLGKTLLPIFEIMARQSCGDIHKQRDGKKILKTDGQLVLFGSLGLAALRDRRLMKIWHSCIRIAVDALSRERGQKCTFADYFEIYFGIDHPNTQLARIVYG